MASQSDNNGRQEKRYVYAEYFTHKRELRVSFYTLSGVGFSLDELADLEKTIAKAKRYLASRLNPQADLYAKYQTQLTQMQPVPT